MSDLASQPLEDTPESPLTLAENPGTNPVDVLPCRHKQPASTTGLSIQPSV